jgi:hypothetical protein
MHKASVSRMLGSSSMTRTRRGSRSAPDMVRRRMPDLAREVSVGAAG